MKNVLLSLCCLFAVACNNVGSGQQSNMLPPHVTDNKVLDDNTCAKFNAGYASALYNSVGSLPGKNIIKWKLVARGITTILNLVI